MRLYTFTNGAGLTSMTAAMLTASGHVPEVADNKDGTWSAWMAGDVGSWGAWRIYDRESMTEAEAIAWLEERS